jgi:hypothetical protein
MAKRDAASEPIEKSPEEIAAEKRAADLAHIISKLPASCSDDMKNGEVFGRCIERLKTWGATDDEVSDNIPGIRKAVDAHVTERDARIADRARQKAVMEAQAIGKSLA